MISASRKPCTTSPRLKRSVFETLSCRTSCPPLPRGRRRRRADPVPARPPPDARARAARPPASRRPGPRRPPAAHRRHSTAAAASSACASLWASDDRDRLPREDDVIPARGNSAAATPDSEPLSGSRSSAVKTADDARHEPRSLGINADDLRAGVRAEDEASEEHPGQTGYRPRTGRCPSTSRGRRGEEPRNRL